MAAPNKIAIKLESMIARRRLVIPLLEPLKENSESDDGGELIEAIKEGRRGSNGLLLGPKRLFVPKVDGLLLMGLKSFVLGSNRGSINVVEARSVPIKLKK